MRKILLGLALALLATSAIAQTCPTRPPGDNSNACASTAFVHGATAAAPLPDGQIFIGNSSNVATPRTVSGDATLSDTGVLTVTASGAPSVPAGRLTLISGQPVMNADAVAVQNLYYAPAGKGSTVPILSGSAFVNRSFVSSATDQVGLTLALAGSANWPSNTIYDVFAIQDSGTTKLATRAWTAGMLPTESLISAAAGTVITTGTGAQAWVRSANAFDGTTVRATVTAAVNTPSNSGLTNWIGKDWGVGQTKTVSRVLIYQSTDNGLRGDEPTSLKIRIDVSSDCTNWAISDVLFVNASVVGATISVPVSVTNQVPYRCIRLGVTGDGASSVVVAQLQFFEIVAPASGRLLTKYNGIWVNDAAMTARTTAAATASVAQYEGTFLGVIQTDPSATGSLTAYVQYGSNRMFNVWNAYNQEPIKQKAGVVQTSATPTTGYSYNVTSTIYAQCQTGFQLNALVGLPTPYKATMPRPFYIDATAATGAYEAGISVDNTIIYSGTEVSGNIDTTGQAVGFQATAAVVIPPGYAGERDFYCIEARTSGTGTVSLFTDQRNTYLLVEYPG